MLRIQNPRVNGLNAPPGLDERFPVFSWQLTGTRRGEEPAACRVKVASTKAGLRSEDGEVLWDSGKRCGHELSLSYEGPALRGNRRYWWQAEVWDCDGSRYAMEPAWWETGLFSGDWQAEWIWRAGDIVINDFVYFRKTFELGAPVVRAKLFVSAHHIVQLYVNGQRVSGFGSPAPTGVPRRKFYLAYDVTSLLSHGANCIGACVHYLGAAARTMSTAPRDFCCSFMRSMRTAASRSSPPIGAGGRFGASRIGSGLLINRTAVCPPWRITTGACWIRGGLLRLTTIHYAILPLRPARIAERGH